MAQYTNRFSLTYAGALVLATPLFADVTGTGGPDAEVLPPDHCAADIAGEDFSLGADGKVSEVDLMAFLKEFSVGSEIADVDDGWGEGIPDGGVTIEDLLYYLMHYSLGC